MGVATTLVMGIVIRRVTAGDSVVKVDGIMTKQAQSTSSKSRDVIEVNSSDNNTREIQSTDLMDSPDLDLRLIRKAEAVIRMRSGNLIVVIERSTNSWNHSACLRTAEALVSSDIYLSIYVPFSFFALSIGKLKIRVCFSHAFLLQGIQNVWIIDPAAANQDNPSMTTDDEGTANTNIVRDKKNRLLHLTTEEAEQRRQHHLFARNATEWLSIREFDTTHECILALREAEYQIYVTDLSQKAVELNPDSLNDNGRWPLPNKMAIVFGTEAVGCSEEMLNAADLRVYLPLRGFADSLNLSVATALVIHHLLLMEPSYVASMTEEERRELRKLWFPKLARQRLLSAKDKKTRRRLIASISKFETLRAQTDQGTEMTNDQKEKIGKLDAYRKELAELEQNAKFDASSQLVQDLIEKPPDPLSDLRRADAHRVTFAGKGVKKANLANWKGMVAVTGAQTKLNSTAGYFREKLAQVDIIPPSST